LKWTPRPERNKLIIHTTSSDSLLKGFKTIAHAARLLKNAGVQFEWRVAGLSKESFVVRLVEIQMTKDFGELPLVLLGKIPSEILTQKLMEADMFVLPSNIENSPNSLCEAMLLSMPCITTNSGGTPSLLTDGVDGYMVQPGDPWSLAGAVMDIKNDYARAIEMGRCAHERALKRHDPDKIINQVLHAYNTILEER
jgi:glycosyltransferase involved in cell wall biosynthesis